MLNFDFSPFAALSLKLSKLSAPKGNVARSSHHKRSPHDVTRPKKYSELSAREEIQADCDVKAKNIILQGLPPEVYALVSNHKVAKELWERIQLLMQGTSLTKQERECKLYDEFDKFTYKKGKHYLFYLRFSLLLNDMNIYNMKLEHFQVNIKFLNTLPPEWSKFVTDVKLIKTQVVNCTKINLDNKSVNDTLTAELERYKEQVKVLKEGQNVDLKSNDNVLDSSAQSVEIDRLKQTLSEHLKEKESLMQTVTLLKNDFKKEESRNIDREIALEKRIKQLDNIVFKRDQSAQTVHMLTKPQFFYDHTTKQALGFQNPFYQKKAQQLEPKLYDGNVIKNTSAIVIPDSEETLMLAEESRSKMILKQKDPMMLEKKVNTTPVNYAVLNQLSQDFKTRFVPQTELSAEQAFWSQNSVNSPDPTLSSRPTKVEVPKELLKVSMVNTSLKKLKHHLAGFDMVVKERTTATAITEDSWGFEHTKACFRDEIIPFVKALKDLFNTFDQYLIDELSEVQNVFHQMEQAVEQHRLESKTFEVKMNQVLNENERLLEQIINTDIVNIIINSSVDNASVNVHECELCLKFKTELLNKKDFVEKEIYDKLFRSFTTLEKHCISLEVDTQLNLEIFQRDNSISNQSAPSFDQLFELNELKAQS
ncbi:hypothetical protein Tco_1029524 [Tanacetum coccineum]|uniref:Integrase, catalytic region, zinc finger, CCHC-type, peptidase aspartic, catalytic n=1 Tax=Tanacetum coccineum TaxID=301880 RepID=A0ABQ5G582_9ASTR